MQASSQNQLAACYMGIPVKRIHGLAWALAGAAAAVAGILFACKGSIDPNTGFLGIKAFAAAVIGGFGSLLRALSIRDGDEQLCFLPLCHVLERLVSVFVPVAARSVVNFAESIETVFDNLREVSPATFGPAPPPQCSPVPSAFATPSTAAQPHLRTSHR